MRRALAYSLIQLFAMTIAVEDEIMGELMFSGWLLLIGCTYLVMWCGAIARRLITGRDKSKQPRIHASPTVLTIDEGATLSSFVGVFVIVGALFWSSMAVIVIWKVVDLFAQLPSGEGILLWIPGLLSRFLLLGSIYLGFSRSGVVIDGEAKSLTFWWGLVVPMKKRTIRVSDYDKVTVEKNKRKAGARHTGFVIRLDGPIRSMQLHASEFADRQSVLAVAKQVSNVTRIPVHDSCGLD